MPKRGPARGGGLKEPLEYLNPRLKDAIARAQALKRIPGKRGGHSVTAYRYAIVVAAFSRTMSDIGFTPRETDEQLMAATDEFMQKRILMRGGIALEIHGVEG